MKYRMLTEWQAAYIVALAQAAREVVDSDVMNLSDHMGRLIDALADYDRDMPYMSELPEAEVNP